jgi:hypothetical protein
MSLAPVGGGGGSQGGDIIWGAYIEDHTQDFWNQQAIYFQQMNVQINNWTNNFVNSFNRFGNQGRSAITGVRGAVLSLNQAVHLFSHIFGPAIRQFEEFAQESIDLAADANMLKSVLSTVGTSAGYTQREMDNLEQTMVQHGITIRGARQVMLEMVQTNLDLADAQTLVARAQDVAIARDIDFTETAQSMIHAIATLNPLVLRRRGIIVDFEQAYRDYAKSIDVAWESLTLEQKQMVATQATLKATEPLVGAFGAAMETAGGKVRLLAPAMENLQVALGQIAQPAYAEAIDMLSIALEDALRWTKTHEDSLEGIATRLEGWIETIGVLTRVLTTFGNYLLEWAALVGGPNSPLAQIQNLFQPPEGWEQGTTSQFARVGATLVTTAYYVAGQVTLKIKEVEMEYAKLMAKLEHPLRAKFQTDFLENLPEVQDYRKSFLQFWGELPQVYYDSLQGLDKLSTGEDHFAKEAEDAGDTAVDAMGRIAAQTKEAISAIEDLNDAITEDMAKLTLRIEREDFEEQIRVFRQLTDSYRDYMRSLEDIHIRYNRRLVDLQEDTSEKEKELAKDQADKRLELEKDHAEKRLKIELEYVRDLEDIQRHYVEDVQEAARQNDAVAVAQLMRKKARDRRDARIERERDLVDEDKDYQKRLDELKEFEDKRRKELKDDAAKRLQDLEKDLQDQLEDAERARQRELDDMALYNKRRQDDIALQRKWELEDLQAKHKDEMEELAQHLAAMEDLSDESLAYLLQSHLDYYADELIALTQHYRDMEDLAEQHRTMYDPSGYGWGTPSPMATPGEPGYYEEDPNRPIYNTYGRIVQPAQPVAPPSTVRAPAQQTQPALSPEVGRYNQYLPKGPNVPSNIQQLCAANPNDPICKWYGLQEGGVYVTNQPTRFMSSEHYQPEMIAAIPLGKSSSHNINLNGSFNVSGVTPGTERDIKGEIMSAVKQLGEALNAGV